MTTAIPHLPLLNFLEEKFNIEANKPLKGYICFFIQHLLGSNLSLIRSLEKSGIERNNLYIIGKAYSSNKDVLSYLEDNGYNYVNPIIGYSTETCYDDILKKEIRNIMSNVLRNSKLPVLLIDDAAKGIGIVHENDFRQHISRFKCIELTTRGIRELNKIKAECPIVDVASSSAKRNVESIIIAESMVNEFFHFLDKWRDFYQPRNRHILLIGYGAIGKNVCQRLSALFQITVYDINETARLQACKDGINVTSDVSKEQYGIIIGCTGLSIDIDLLKTHSDTLFVNMSSSDLEFGLWRFNGQKGLMRDRYEVRIIENHLHEFYFIEEKGKTFFVANGGFPIDFTGGIDPIHPNKIQITRALVFAASLQALSESDNDKVELDARNQEEIVNKYLSYHYGREYTCGL